MLRKMVITIEYATDDVDGGLPKNHLSVGLQEKVVGENGVSMNQIPTTGEFAFGRALAVVLADFVKREECASAKFFAGNVIADLPWVVSVAPETEEDRASQNEFGPTEYSMNFGPAKQAV